MLTTSRRTLLLSLTALAATACASLADCGEDVLAYVGLEGGHIEALRLDTCTGRLTALGPVADLPRPRWLVADPARALLYAASDPQGHPGSVAAYAIDRASGALRKQGELGAGGNGTTDLWLDSASASLLAAHFGSGSVSSLALQADGGLGQVASTRQNHGSGPHRRQAGPHAHGVVLAPDGRHALVADFGADRVFVYGFDRATHSLSEAPVGAFAAPPGSGPHHLVFGAGGRFAYLLNELSADVTTLRWNAQAARLDAVQTVPLSSPGFAGVKSGSELALSADGRFLYAANRAQSQVLVYGVDAATGELRLLQRQASGGEAPWTFALHPSGNWMLVAHARGNRVDLLGVDPATGRLSATDQVLQMAAPLSLAFVD